MWHGMIANIPDGWHLCDGTNGTPDLRSRFVRGAPVGLNPGGTGGLTEHRHTVAGNTGSQSADHTHQIEGYTEGPQSGLYEFYYDYDGYEQYELHTHYIDFPSDTEGQDHQHTFFDFSTFSGNFPPYYDVVFIMKL